MKFCPVCGEQYGEAEKFCPADGTTLRATDPGSDLVDQVIADRYHIRRRLGEGGMGIVYLAEHVRMSRPCAIKVLSSTLTADADAITRFNREAANASRINHPNVCAVYDFGETADGLIYLAMEFVDGETLTALLERGQLPVKDTVEILSQCAAGLHAAHELGIVHRDLKPDNIMVVGPAGRRQVKVVDFGIAKAGAEKAQQVTRTGLVVGTPEYMSPEQVSGDVLDARSDTYSLGLICYRMLTGATPFQSENPQETLTRRLTDPPEPIALARPDLAFPPGLQEVLDRGLARRPGERFATVTAFTDALARVASEEGELRSAATTRIIAPAGADAVPRTRVATRPRQSFRVAPLALGTGIVLAALAAGWAVMDRPDSPAGNREPGWEDTTRMAAAVTETTALDSQAATRDQGGPPDQSTSRPSTGDSLLPAPRSRLPAAVALPTLDDISNESTRSTARERAIRIYRRTDVRDSVRAEAAALAGQSWLEDKDLPRAREWFALAYALNPRDLYRRVLDGIDGNLNRMAD